MAVWTEASRLGSRKEWLGEVLGAVRMALLHTAYLISTVGANPLP